MNRIFYLSSIILLLALVACDDYLGKKTDISFIDIPEFTQREVAYVPIQPVLNQFIRPVDICVGFDEMIYIADAGAQQIVCIDESGRELSRFNLPGVKSVVQDRRFDLLAIGTLDTMIAGVTRSLSCIYRINLQGATGYGLRSARITNKIVHPYYFKSSFSNSDADVTFNGIAVIGSMDPSVNNRFLVTRSGPSANNAGQGPDDAVIQFSNQDVYQSPILVNTSAGLFNNYFKKPFGISSFTQPPQFTARLRPDFYVTMLGEDAALKVQLIEFSETDFGAEYRPVIFPVGDTATADGYLYQPNRFSHPTGVRVTGDATNFVFVVDTEKDSVYQFTSNGIEGVPPPPAANTTKYQMASFGGTGEGLTQFREPHAACVFRRILYVADAGNGRILRFRLTTDFD
jgi:hypothetical protein